MELHNIYKQQVILSLLKQHFPAVKIIENSQNKGFSPTINKGIFSAQYDYVLLLNSDVLLSEDYFIPLLRYFDKEDTFGVMGRIVGWDDDLIQDAAKYPSFHGAKIKTTGNYYLPEPQKNDWLFSMYLSGANAFVDRKKLYDAKEATLTRVVETTDFITSLSKAYTRTGLDEEMFLQKLYKEFPNLKKRINTIYEECKTVIEVNGRIDVKLKTESLHDTIKNVVDKLKTQIKKFVDKIYSYLDSYDRMLFELKQGLIKEIQKESQDILIDKSNKVMMLLD